MPAETHLRKLRIIFIAPNPEYDFYLPVKRGMAEASAMLGVESSFVGTDGVDARVQAQMVRDAVARGYDGIALSIIDPQAFNAVVQEAINNGVPVVAFNVDANPTSNARLSAVCQNLYGAGRRLGTAAASFVRPHAKILATMHDPGVSALEDRLKGVQDSLQQLKVNWSILFTGTKRDAAIERIREALAADPAIQTVLATGMIDTEAAGLAIETHYPGQGYATAGFDLSLEIVRLVKNGTIRFTIDQQPYIQGFYPVVQLTLYRRYGIKPSNIDAGADIISAENAEAVKRLIEDHHR